MTDILQATKAVVEIGGGGFLNGDGIQGLYREGRLLLLFTNSAASDDDFLEGRAVVKAEVNFQVLVSRSDFHLFSGVAGVGEL